MNNAQEYLEKNWTDQSIKEISLHSQEQKLQGELIISDYPNLEEINLTNHELTSLTIVNCPNLKHINVRNNKLINLELEKVKLDNANQAISNEINEIIASGNELVALNLIHCEKLSKLMVADNSALNKLSNLNLTNIRNINITNTLISLNEDYESLKIENDNLLQLVKEIDKMGQQKKLTLVEPIQTVKQAKEAIQRHLKETELSWREYFEGNEITQQEKTSLHLSFENPKLNWKGRDILTLIVETQVNEDYESLLKKWQEASEQKTNPLIVLDGSLGTFNELYQNYQSLLSKQ